MLSSIRGKFGSPARRCLIDVQTHAKPANTQIDSIAKALKDVYEDLGKKATEWGPDLREQLKNAVQVIALDIVKNGKISKDGQDAIAAVDFGRCTFGIEPGMSTYSSETCEFCCNCIPNMNAVRFYLAWRLDCRP